MKQLDQKMVDKQTVRLMWKHAWRYKKLTLGLLAMAPFGTLVGQFIQPLIVASILDRLSKGHFKHGDVWGSFGPTLLMYAAGSILAGVVIWRIIVFLIWRLEMNVQRDMHQRIFNHMVSLSANFHANRFGGSLVSQANKFAGSYVRFADTTVFQMIPLTMAFIFAAIILTPKVPQVVVVMGIFAAVFITSAILVTRKVRELNAIEASAGNKQTGFLADAITNVLAVKSFASSKFEKKRYAAATEHTRSTTNDVMWASTRRDIIFASMNSSLDITALIVAVASVVLFDANITNVYLVMSYSSSISRQLWEFCQSTLRNYNRGLADARDMTEILLLEPDVKDPAKPKKLKITNGSLAFSNMTFTHPESGEQDALFQNLNLQISAGEKIGLVGHSGSGKTSLTKLLLRFNDIDGGTITIDGQDIASITQDDLRASIAYVPQEPLLFHRSIRENIAYGQPDATDEEVIAAARKANAHDFIVKLAKGYETLVGERGVKLSGGQRQRIAIARAILKDAPILVLDEATSALDSESEKLIQDALWKLMEGRTAIVIAHRLSTIQKMDRIIVLDDGRIAEEGSHMQLVENKGIYASLWAHQSGGFLED